jgi:hypothetical protein
VLFADDSAPLLNFTLCIPSSLYRLRFSQCDNFLDRSPKYLLLLSCGAYPRKLAYWKIRIWRNHVREQFQIINNVAVWRRIAFAHLSPPA